jgi:cytochrome b561
MMRAPLILLAAGAALAACGAQKAAPAAAAAPAVEGAWLVDKAASRIEFSGTQTGKPFTGRFETFDAVIVFDPEDLASARIEATIETGSAKTGDRQRDAALPGAEWFSANAFPQARFASTSVTAAEEGAFIAAGTLSIRGVEKSVTLPFTLAIEQGRATADGSITLNRSDFGVGQGEKFLTDKWVGYDVTVSVHIEATR